MTVVRTEGVPALYKGLAPTLVGIAPYAAINFASYDLLKRRYYGDGSDRRCGPSLAAVSSCTFAFQLAVLLDHVSPDNNGLHDASA